jgi:hypothetical protein
VTQKNEGPIIIYGSVRAGTTMFRLMVGAHPELVEIGENRYLIDCLEKGVTDGIRYDVGRLEQDRVFNLRSLTREAGLNGPELVTSIMGQLRNGREGPIVLTFHADIKIIERLFPDARYIHICRDPRDVAKSVTGFGWSGNVYYGADFWLASEVSWETFASTADPKRFLEIRYEDLVLEPESHLRRVCDFLGIGFDEAMLEYSKTSTYSKPDPKLLQRWRTSLTRRQIALVEYKCGALMEKRGYSRDCEARQTPGPLEKGFLAVDNKARKVASAISFFGLRDYFLEKLYRLRPFRGLHAEQMRRMHETVNRSLK